MTTNGRAPMRPEDIRAITDPQERALAAITYRQYALDRAADGLRLRDEAIRAMRRTMSQPDIARVLGVSLGTVKQVCR